MNLTAEITTWQTGRTACIERESDTSAWRNEIQGYDDEATRLVDQVGPIITAAERLMALDVDMWFDNSTAFSCNESDAIANLLRVTHDEDTAQAFLVSHAEGDDSGDDHWHLNPESLNGAAVDQ